MALTNKIENIIIAGSVAVVSTIMVMVVVHFLTIRPLQRQIEKQNEVIIELAKIEKYKYEISNDFGKIKPKDGQVIIDLDNKLDALTVTPDTIQVNDIVKKKTFWKKLQFWD
jgi:preprotein translocase subunit YajC